MKFLNEALLRVLSWQGLQTPATDEKGQTLAEYGLIMAVIAVSVVVAALSRSAAPSSRRSTARWAVWTAPAKPSVGASP
jgi:hypothetical protein